jgi:ribosomal protein L11 methyltransferase
MWRLSFLSSVAEAEYLASQLEDFCLAVSWFEKDAQAQVWQVEATFEEQPDEKNIKSLLGALSYELAPLPSKDWLSENRKSFPAIDIGPFYIYGSHHQEKLPEGKIAFRIDAATAFGTGQHATTQGCLLALHDLKQAGIKVQNYLDLGCGTAVLAMAMARLFQVRGIASDNDPEAVDRANLNVAENHLERFVEVILSEGVSHERLEAQAPYSLIAANILVDPLIALSPEMARFMAEEGKVILSGLLQTQQHATLKAYEKVGFSLQKTYPMAEWVTLVLKKNGKSIL